MNRSVLVYGDTADAPVSDVMQGLESAGLRPLPRNPRRFKPDETEACDAIAVFLKYGKAGEIAAAYDVPTIGIFEAAPDGEKWAMFLHDGVSELKQPVIAGKDEIRGGAPFALLLSNP